MSGCLRDQESEADEGLMVYGRGMGFFFCLEKVDESAKRE